MPAPERAGRKKRVPQAEVAASPDGDARAAAASSAAPESCYERRAGRAGDSASNSRRNKPSSRCFVARTHSHGRASRPPKPAASTARAPAAQPATPQKTGRAKQNRAAKCETPQKPTQHSRAACRVSERGSRWKCSASCHEKSEQHKARQNQPRNKRKPTRRAEGGLSERCRGQPKQRKRETHTRSAYKKITRVWRSPEKRPKTPAKIKWHTRRREEIASAARRAILDVQEACPDGGFGWALPIGALPRVQRLERNTSLNSAP